MRISWLLPLAIAGALLAAPAAEAHAKLVETSPAAGSVAETAPTEIRLTFNEEVTASLSHVALAADNGGTVALGAVAAKPDDAKTIVVAVPAPLAAGKYTVTWSTVSADMHKVNGSFDFTVGH